MTTTYRLVVQIDAENCEGEFYLAGEGHGTASDVLQYVAADHILAADRATHIEAYLLGVLEDGENVPKSAYDTIDADVNCGVHIDVDFGQVSFWSDDQVVEIGDQPTASKLASIAADIR